MDVCRTGKLPSYLGTCPLQKAVRAWDRVQAASRWKGAGLKRRAPLFGIILTKKRSSGRDGADYTSSSAPSEARWVTWVSLYTTASEGEPFSVSAAFSPVAPPSKKPWRWPPTGTAPKWTNWCGTSTAETTSALDCRAGPWRPGKAWWCFFFPYNNFCNDEKLDLYVLGDPPLLLVLHQI